MLSLQLYNVLSDAVDTDYSRCAESPLSNDLENTSIYALLSLSHSKSNLCRFKSCNQTASKRSQFCTEHIGSKVCEMVGCFKYAQGGTLFCFAHGGGRRCTFEGCSKGARGLVFCALHGGGRVSGI